MQAVAELVEQGACIVKTEQGRFALRRGREIVVVDDQRAHRTVEVGLAAKHAHPGARALVVAGKVVADEHPHMLTLCIAHFPGLQGFGVAGGVRQGLEAQTEQLPGHMEHGLGQSRELQIGLDLRLLECVAVPAHLFGPVVPVPSVQLRRRVVGLALAGEGQHVVVFLLRTPAGRLPDGHQQLAGSCRAAGHGVGQGLLGAVCIAQQSRLLQPQLQNLADQRQVVVFGQPLAALAPGLPQGLAQGPVFAEGHERHQRGAREGDHMGLRIGVSASQGGGTRRGPNKVGQALQFLVLCQHLHEGAFVGQHIL